MRGRRRFVSSTATRPSTTCSTRRRKKNADSSYRERYYGGDDGLSKAEYLAKINPSLPYPAEGRFDCNCCAERYEDLRNAFGWNCEQLQSHWNTSGQSEGRIGSCDAGT